MRAAVHGLLLLRAHAVVHGSTGQEKPASAVAMARVVVDATVIDQGVAYLLMFAALFVTYLSHWY